MNTTKTRHVTRLTATCAVLATAVAAALVGTAGVASATTLFPGEGTGSGFCSTNGGIDGANLDNVYACANYNISDLFGYQCVELSNRFEWAVYGKLPVPGASGAALVADLHAQDGIPVDSNTSGHFPVVGDVISMSGDAGSDPIGHTAVVTAVNVNPATGTGSITTMGQNDTHSGVNHITVTSPTSWHINSGYYYYTHFQWTLQGSRLAYQVLNQSITATAGDGRTAPVTAAEAASSSWLGETGHLSVTVQNTGTDTWGPGADNVRLGTAGPNDRTSLLYTPSSGWVGPNRAAAVTTTVPPGGSYTFTFGFTLDAPGAAVTSVSEHFNLVDELVSWFPDNGPTFTFGVAKRVDRGIAMVHSGANAGYTLDPDGTVHAFGGTPQPTGYATWPGWDIARGIVVRPNGTSGYTLDGYGGLHPFGGAPAVVSTAYWSGWDIARGLVLRPDGVSGYILDGYGGLHPFGGAPAVVSTAYWSGWDIARGLVLRPDGVSGYILDGYGGLHPFGGAPAVVSTAYWSGWDIARSLALTSAAGGYVLDGFGGLHPFGTASALTTPAAAYTGGWDKAKALAVTSTGTTGQILDGRGLRYLVN